MHQSPKIGADGLQFSDGEGVTLLARHTKDIGGDSIKVGFGCTMYGSRQKGGVVVATSAQWDAPCMAADRRVVML